MNEKIRDASVDLLMDAILSIEDRRECFAFFEDICTVAEIKSMAARLKVAVLLKSGCTYAEIGEITGASAATISRVNRALAYGADGYETVIRRLKDDGKVE